MQSAESDEFNRKSLRQKNLGTHRRVTIYQYEASTGPIRSRFVAMHTSEVPILQRLRYRIDRILRFACSQGCIDLPSPLEAVKQRCKHQEGNDLRKSIIRHEFQ